MKPIEHSKLHAKKYGGEPFDYIEIDTFLDSSKATHGTVKHRAIYHHTLGCFLVEKIFGYELINTSGKAFSPRQIAEDHIIQDVGFLPSVEDWLEEMSIESWMGNPITSKKYISLEPTADETKFINTPGAFFD